MDENDKAAVNARKLQEEQENIIKTGFLKENAKWYKALFDAYCGVGFRPEQALELVKAHIVGKQ